MAPQAAEEASEDRDDQSSTTSDSEENDVPVVESLVSGKERRRTAGNRLSSLLQHEEDDELELLFAEGEAEEDQEFEAEVDEDISDAHLDSSSDEEDRGQGQEDDELAGEKELQRRERAEARKKRKSHGPIKRGAPPTKRIRHNPLKLPTASSTLTTPTTPDPRPKKKSERASWIPTPDEGPTRSSTRKQTIQNKAVIHERLKERETLRAKTLEVMTAAEKRKKEQQQKPMTQEERLQEAAKQETRNAKTLNRWEASEEKKRLERKAKLEALQNRNLEGPVITWWSGLSRWVDGNIQEVGVKAIRRVEKAEADKDQPQQQDTEMLIVENPTVNSNPTDQDGNAVDGRSNEGKAVSSDRAEQNSNAIQPSSTPKQQEPLGFLDGIRYYASLQHQPDAPDHQVQEESSDLQNISTNHPEPTPMVMIASRSLLILQNIDEEAQRLPEIESLVIHKKRGNKLPRPSHDLCAITAQPGRYRDPGTGLAYVDRHAYSTIQKLRQGIPVWSSLFECYVGSSSEVARGVPNRFAQGDNA